MPRWRRLRLVNVVQIRRFEPVFYLSEPESVKTTHLNSHDLMQRLNDSARRYGFLMGGKLNSHWFNKLITGRRNENAKWEVWDQIRTGEVNVALWGQRDRPVALCISDRGEQWDITHPENTAQKVRGAHEYISVCPTVGLSPRLSAHSHAWLQVAAFAKMCFDRLRPRENGSPSSCTGGCSTVMGLREITEMQSKEQIKVYMSETDRADVGSQLSAVWVFEQRAWELEITDLDLRVRKALLNKEIFD